MLDKKIKHFKFLMLSREILPRHLRLLKKKNQNKYNDTGKQTEQKNRSLRNRNLHLRKFGV